MQAPALMAVASVAAVAALALAPRGGRLWPRLLGAAALLGAVALPIDAAARGVGAFSDLRVGLAGWALAIALAALAWPVDGRAGRLWAAAALALGYLAWWLLPGTRQPLGPEPWWLFGLGEGAYVLGAGAMAWMVWRGWGAATWPRAARQGLGVGWLLLASSLGLVGLAAQRAWGAYWSWDPLECWRLAAWLGASLALLATGDLGWQGRASRWIALSAAALALAALLGAGPLFGWLGQASRYLP